MAPKPPRAPLPGLDDSVESVEALQQRLKHVAGDVIHNPLVLPAPPQAPPPPQVAAPARAPVAPAMAPAPTRAPFPPIPSKRDLAKGRGGGAGNIGLTIMVPETTRQALREAAAASGSSIRYLILKALADAGWPVPEESLVEDGRRR